jgi:hypothetical protein
MLTFNNLLRGELRNPVGLICPEPMRLLERESEKLFS